MRKKKPKNLKRPPAIHFRDLLRQREEEIRSEYPTSENIAVLEEHLLKLYILDAKSEKSPLDCIQAFLSCATVQVPPPEWAADKIDAIFKDRMSGKLRNLDKAFDFKRPLVERRNERLMLDIWRLRLLKYTLDEACDLVARRLLSSSEWNQSGFDISFRSKKPIDFHRLTGTLRTMYYNDGWHKLFNSVEKNQKDKVFEQLNKNRNAFLSQFPRIDTDS